MGSGGEDRLETGWNHRDTEELDEHTGNFGKNRNDEGEGDAEKEQFGSFTRTPSIEILCGEAHQLKRLSSWPEQRGLGLNRKD